MTFPATHRWRWVASFLLILAIAGLGWTWSALVTSFDAAPHYRSLAFFGIGFLGTLLYLLIPAFSAHGKEILYILAVATVLRLVFVPAAPSDDVYRYVWEGRLVANGQSPYAAPASDPQFDGFHEELRARMNHPDALTAYPPVSQFIFAALSLPGWGPPAFKNAFLLLDIGVVGLLIWLLRLHRLPIRLAGLYAFSPLPLAAFAAEGHFDVLLVLTLLGTVLADQKRQPLATGLLLGLAFQIKFVAILLLPFALSRHRRVPLASGFAIAGLAPFLAFLPDLENLFKGLAAFGSSVSFNGLLHHGIHLASGSRTLATTVVAGLFGLLILWRWGLHRRAPLESTWVWLGGGLILLSPTVHFWYLAWILPFTTLRPSLTWLGFSWMQGMYFQVWDRERSGLEWGLEPWQILTAWLPVLVLGPAELVRARRRIRHRVRTECSIKHPPGVSVVIPSLRDTKRLEAALTELGKSHRKPDEVLVVEAGDPEQAGPVAKAGRARLLTTETRGRGSQIYLGVAAARFETILVLHADYRIHPEAIGAIDQVHRQEDPPPGGCLGQRYDQADGFLLGLEALNEFRATMLQTGFGDQAIFWHRQFFPDSQVPSHALMEDVELSLRLRDTGPFIYLGVEGTVSARRWSRQRRFRFREIVRMLLTYRLVRLLHPERTRDLADQLYQKYYPNPKKP